MESYLSMVVFILSLNSFFIKVHIPYFWLTGTAADNLVMAEEHKGQGMLSWGWDRDMLFALR